MPLLLKLKTIDFHKLTICRILQTAIWASVITDGHFRSLLTESLAPVPTVYSVGTFAEFNAAIFNIDFFLPSPILGK
ncbi:hypothetical protein IH824_17050 [candidate division KSB1 bacterium]|nr:hypothetical protein [candidate division KSB1 bacterium]